MKKKEADYLQAFVPLALNTGYICKKSDQTKNEVYETWRSVNILGIFFLFFFFFFFFFFLDLWKLVNVTRLKPVVFLASARNPLWKVLAAGCALLVLGRRRRHRIAKKSRKRSPRVCIADTPYLKLIKGTSCCHRVVLPSRSSWLQWVVVFIFVFLSFFSCCSICNPQNPCSIFQLDKQSSRLSPTMMKLMTMLMLMTMVMPMALLTLLFPPWRLLLPPLLLHLPPLLWFVYMFYFEQCFIQLYLFIYLL